MKCCICNKSDLRILYCDIERDGMSYDLYQCTECGLGVTVPFPKIEKLEKLYSSDNYRDHERRFVYPLEQLSRYFRRNRWRKISKNLSNGRILDIGCGRGVMLNIAKKHGWEAYGLEFNDDTAFHAREIIGPNVRTGNIKNSKLEIGTFDVITIWHSLEHLENPSETIIECNRLLKPNGRLIIAVPNLKSIQSQLSKRQWLHLDIPYHLYHFSEGNLSLLLKKCGFSVISVKHFSLEQNLFGFIQSLFNMTNVSYNFLYDIIKSKQLRKNNAISSQLRDIFETLVLMPIILPLSMALTAHEVILKKGGSIEIHARKEKR